MPRVIVHLDADAFFAAAEQAGDPKLRGKPIAVGGERRGIIASASYEARKFGVYTPMPTVRARKLCPKLIVLPGNFERYEQFSNWMFGYCYDFTPDVEQTSIDDGYFDLTANRKKSPAEIALTIRRAIGQKLKISVSEGIATNKLASAVASKLTKPAAFNEIHPGREQDGAVSTNCAGILAARKPISPISKEKTLIDAARQSPTPVRKPEVSR